MSSYWPNALLKVSGSRNFETCLVVTMSLFYSLIEPYLYRVTCFMFQSFISHEIILMFFAGENCQCKNCTCTYDNASLVEIWLQKLAKPCTIWQNFKLEVAAAVGHRRYPHEVKKKAYFKLFNSCCVSPRRSFRTNAC